MTPETERALIEWYQAERSTVRPPSRPWPILGLDQLIAVLLGLDPNGCYTDDECTYTAGQPLTRDDALGCLYTLLCCGDE
jgi:hypothetical protein